MRLILRASVDYIPQMDTIYFLSFGEEKYPQGKFEYLSYLPGTTPSPPSDAPWWSPPLNLKAIGVEIVGQELEIP